MLLFLSACERTELNPDDESLGQPTGIENVELVNSELHFTNPDTYFDDVQQILDMNEIELNEWEASIGFQSLRSVINEANEEFGNLASEDDIPAWKEKYKDVVTFRKDEVEPLVSLGYYQTIANRSGEYMIGDAYGKVVPGKLIMILDGDRSRLNKAKTLEKSNEEQGIIIAKYGSKKRILLRADECPNSSTMYANRTNGKRRVYLEYETFEETNSGYSWTRVSTHTYGHKKVFFSWHIYATRHYAEQINWEVVNFYGVPKSLANDFSYLTLVDVQHVYHYFSLGDLAPTWSYDLNPVFAKAKGRATTRGTDRKWADFCCGGYSNCPASEGISPFSN